MNTHASTTVANAHKHVHTRTHRQVQVLTAVNRDSDLSKASISLCHEANRHNLEKEGYNHMLQLKAKKVILCFECHEGEGTMTELFVLGELYQMCA